MSKMQPRVLAVAIAFGCMYRLCTRRPRRRRIWQTNFEAAKAKAMAEKKFLLVDFTGSDWCIWCKRLKAEVFDKDEFRNEAPKHFVLVELDFPATKKLPTHSRSRTSRCGSKYKIRGYPTVLVLDPAGEVVAHTGYQAGGPDGYVKQLSEFLNVYATVVKMKQELAVVEGPRAARNSWTSSSTHTSSSTTRATS